MSEWNPSDPETAKVFYDLSGWDIDQQAELAAELADAEIPHTWEGTELVIPPDAEPATDAIFADREARLGIAGAAQELSADTATTDYDLTEWADLERSLVVDALQSAGIPFRFDEGVLSVPTAAEDGVDEILDEVEDGELIPVINDGPEGDVVPFESLNSFFLAAERLRKNTFDADGLERLLEALAIADPNRPPRGVELRTWRRTCDLAERLADAVAASDPDIEADADTDDDLARSEVRPIAEALHDLLRPLI